MEEAVQQLWRADASPVVSLGLSESSSANFQAPVLAKSCHCLIGWFRDFQRPLEYQEGWRPRPRAGRCDSFFQHSVFPLQLLVAL